MHWSKKSSAASYECEHLLHFSERVSVNPRHEKLPSLLRDDEVRVRQLLEVVGNRRRRERECLDDVSDAAVGFGGLENDY